MFLIGRIVNYYPNSPTHHLNFGEVETQKVEQTLVLRSYDEENNVFILFLAGVQKQIENSISNLAKLNQF